MKVKVLKFPDGKVAVTSGLQVQVNKQKPIIEEEIEVDKKGFDKLLRNPKSFKFSKRAKKPKESSVKAK